MDRHIERLTMADQSKGDLMSPEELYSRSNPGLCGRGMDCTDPRSWYDSKEAKKLLHSFVRKYNSQLSKPGYSDQRALAKFIVDLPQKLEDAVDLGKYSPRAEVAPLEPGRRTTRAAVTAVGTEPVVLHVTNMADVPEVDHRLTVRRKPPCQLPTSEQRLRNQIQIVEEGDLHRIGDHLQLKLEHKLHIPLPPIFMPKATSDEITPADKIRDRVSLEAKKYLPNTHTDVCFLDNQHKFQDLRLPQTKAKENYKETYLLRQRSMLKLKTFAEERLSKARHETMAPRKMEDGGTRTNSKVSSNNKDLSSSMDSEGRRRRYQNDELSVVNCGSSSTGELVVPLSRRVDPENSSTCRKCRPDGEQPDHVTKDKVQAPWPYKKSGAKFLYKCPSDGFLDRVVNDMKREKTSVINLDLNSSQTARIKTRSHCGTPVSNSLQRFLLSRAYSMHGEQSKTGNGSDHRAEEGESGRLLPCVDEQQPQPSPENPSQPKRGYLRKFKRLQIFGETHRPETSQKGRIQWEDRKTSHPLPVLRPPQNYKLDLSPHGKLWQTSNETKPSRPRVRTERTAPGKTTILIDAPVSGYRKWHKGQPTRPLRIEVTFGKTVGRKGEKTKGRRGDDSKKDKCGTGSDGHVPEDFDSGSADGSLREKYTILDQDPASAVEQFSKEICMDSADDRRPLQE